MARADVNDLHAELADRGVYANNLSRACENNVELLQSFEEVVCQWELELEMGGGEGVALIAAMPCCHHALT